MEIIKDQSPYYVSFVDSNFRQIIQLVTSFETNNWKRKTKFSHESLPLAMSEKILDLVPCSRALELNVKRVSIFVSQPGLYYRAHKDGRNLRFGINYPIIIRDNLCLTSWYDDSISIGKKIVTLGGASREIYNFEKNSEIPEYSTSFSKDNIILFNTDIFHDWDNVASNNIRVILTLRSTNPDITFDLAKKILFGF